MKRIAAVLALALALALPASTLAATAGGSEAESFVMGSTVTLTVPASVTYTHGTGVWAGSIALTNIGTDNPTGMRLEMTTSAFAGPVAIPTTARSHLLPVVGGTSAGWSGMVARAAGFYATSATIDVLMTRSTAVTGPATLTLTMQVSDTGLTPGTYTGTLTFFATDI